MPTIDRGRFAEELESLAATLRELDPRARRSSVELPEAPPFVRQFWERIGWLKRFEKSIHPPDRQLSDAKIARALHQWPLAKARHHEVIDALPSVRRLVVDLSLGFLVTDEDRGEDDPPIVHVWTEYPTYRLHRDETRDSYMPCCGRAVANWAFPDKGWIRDVLWFDPLPAGRAPAPSLARGFTLVDDVWFVPSRSTNPSETIQGWVRARSHAAVARCLLTRPETPMGVRTPGSPNVSGLRPEVLAGGARTFETQDLSPGMAEAEVTDHFVIEVEGMPLWFRRYRRWVDPTAFLVTVDTENAPRLARWLEATGATLAE